MDRLLCALFAVLDLVITSLFWWIDWESLEEPE